MMLFDEMVNYSLHVSDPVGLHLDNINVLEGVERLGVCIFMQGVERTINLIV